MEEKGMKQSNYLEEIIHDVRYAARQLGRSPAFTAVATLTLAIGIGATTAIFSAVNAVVLQPLPFSQPDRLVRVYSSSPSTTVSDEVSPKTFAVWHRESRSFAHMAAIETRSFTFADGDQLPQQAVGIRTNADYFPMFGVAPILGRTFAADEDVPGRNRVAVLSHRFWTGRFGGDSTVVGRTVRLNALPFVVIGVMPPDFDVSVNQVDLWTPIAFSAEEQATVETGYLDIIARLRPGVSVSQAQTDLSALTRRMDQGQSRLDRSARVVSYETDLVGTYRPRLFILLGAVALVLLIACVNVANLLLVRGAARSKEIAIRAALGAGRARVLRQLVAESVVLGAIGAAGGLAVAALALRALAGASPEGVPRLDQAGIDGATLGFTMVVALASSIVFGLVPALRVAAPDLHDTLKQGGRSSGAAPSDRVRQSLVVAEVALALVLLVAAGLLIRSAMMLQRVDPGIEATNLWTGAVTLPSAEYTTPERLTSTYQQIAERVREIPGVSAAAVVSVAPFTGLRALGLFVPEGRSVDDRNTLMGNFRLVSPGLFRTLGIPVRGGRDFSDRDDAAAPRVAIVNEAFARLAWPGESAVGKRFLGPGDRGADGPVLREIVGVVGDTREDGLREERRPAVYYPITQLSPSLWGAVQNSMFVVARTGMDPRGITKTVQDVVTTIDRGLPVYSVRSMEERMAEMLATARFTTGLLATMGIVGLLLAVVGIYGVVGYVVSLRTREIGVRVALGASPARVVALVVRQGMRPVLIGVASGAVVAAAVTNVLASQLYGVGPTDPITFVSVAAIVAAAAVLAAALPARRAARIDPVTVLGA
jgi:putative ABC transport system permease protein